MDLAVRHRRRSRPWHVAIDLDVVRVAWFREAGRPPVRQLQREVARLSSILVRDLRAEVSLA